SLVISNIETAFLPSNTASSFFVCADAALILGILELVFADVLPKLFGQFGPGERVFTDHCGQCGVGLHGFAKGVFGGGGFLRSRHRAIRTRLAAKRKINRVSAGQRIARAPRRISAIVLGLFKRRADLLSGLGAGKKRCGLLASIASEQNNANR